MSTAVPQIQAIDATQARTLTPFRPGDTVRVHYRIREGEKERVQVFEGVVIRRKSGGAGATFTVRKVSYGVGVERVFPLHAPTITEIEVVSNRRIRRAKLYFTRKLQGKAAALKEPRYYPRLAQHHHK